jgi:dTDP-4-dehydrorhamnose 3,5-epimerase
LVTSLLAGYGAGEIRHMEVIKTKLKNVLLFKPDIFIDHRGTYTEVFNKKIYSEVIKKHLNEDVNFLTCSEFLSKKNVLRGLHGDNRTWKLFNCSKGVVYIVVVDCDMESDNFGKWESFILSGDNKYQLLIPPMYGNGTLAIDGDAVVYYRQSEYYRGSENQFTYRFDDPRFCIKWPIEKPILSRRDEK